jgi:hypothetical protein
MHILSPDHIAFIWAVLCLSFLVCAPLLRRAVFVRGRDVASAITGLAGGASVRRQARPLAFRYELGGDPQKASSHMATAVFPLRIKAIVAASAKAERLEKTGIEALDITPRNREKSNHYAT